MEPEQNLKVCVNSVSPTSSSWIQVESFDREPRSGTSFRIREHTYINTQFSEILIGSIELVLRHDGSIHLTLASHCDRYDDLILAFERLQSPLTWNRHTRTNTIHVTSYVSDLKPIYALLRTAELADSGIIKISNEIRSAIDSAQLRLDQYREESNIRQGLYEGHLQTKTQITTATYRPIQSTESQNIVTNAQKLEGSDIDIPEQQINLNPKKWCNIL